MKIIAFKISKILVFIMVLAVMAGCCDVKKKGYVYIDDGVFKIKGDTFFPLMLNYKSEMLRFGDDLVFAAAEYYDDPHVYEPMTKEEAEAQFSTHMELVRELGFNSVRLCINVVKKDDKGYFYKTQNDGRAYINEEINKITQAAENLVSIAANHDLKVMFLLKSSWDDDLARLNDALMRKLSDNKEVFAFDLMNEPLYFDIVRDRPKEDAVNLATQWINNAKKAAPNHLVTIGFAEPIEVFGWDASMIPVDFVEIHTYTPLSIPNEILWWSKYIGKPWMIGETSLPADNDSVSYEQQLHFAEQVYQYTIDCGGIGFGWWELQDLPLSYNINYEGTYSGILNHKGTTTTKSGRVIQGSLKPVAYAFEGFKNLKKGTPSKYVNYYNNFGYHNAVVKGKVVDDKTGEPIEGAAVRGWNQWWKTGLNTSTDENGVFNLYSNDECVHFAISAPGYDTKRFDMSLEYRDKNGEPAGFEGLPDREIKSDMIHFGDFLKDETKLFEFKEDKFDKAVVFAEMEDVKLEKLYLTDIFEKEKHGSR